VASEHISISSTAVQFKDGATVLTDISGGNVLIGQTGAGQSNVYITAGAISLRNNTTDVITLNSTGVASIDIKGGGDIALTGSDTDPGVINFKGTDYDVSLSAGTTGAVFSIEPTGSGLQYCYIGLSNPFYNIINKATGLITSKIDVDSNNYSRINQYSSRIELNTKKGGVSQTIYWKHDGTVNSLYPLTTKITDLGQSAHAWDDVYYDDLHNQCLYLDDMDDLKILNEMMPKGTLHKDTQLPELSINSLPKWMTNYDKLRKEIERENGLMISDEDFDELLLDEDGLGWRYYRNFGHFADLTAGAVRQVDKKIDSLLSRIESLENKKEQ